MSDSTLLSETAKLRKSYARLRIALGISAFIIAVLVIAIVVVTSRAQTVTITPSNSSEPSRPICSAGPNGIGTGDCDLPSNGTNPGAAKS